MSNNHNLQNWADAHVFYRLFERGPRSEDDKRVNYEYKWRQKMLEESPNGKLLVDNLFFKNLRSKRKIYLAHVTNNLSQIIKTGTLYSSGGCLIGSVYCTPLARVNKKFRLHNLGRYIFKKEALMVSNDKSRLYPMCKYYLLRPAVGEGWWSEFRLN